MSQTILVSISCYSISITDELIDFLQPWSVSGLDLLMTGGSSTCPYIIV
jgi:hypothetical protein